MIILVHAFSAAKNMFNVSHLGVGEETDTERDGDFPTTNKRHFVIILVTSLKPKWGKVPVW